MRTDLTCEACGLSQWTVYGEPCLACGHTIGEEWSEVEAPKRGPVSTLDWVDSLPPMRWTVVP